jgi:CDP-diacylglycerol---glycerol-3-phosphate 3-phosphatidyltransferase
MNLPNLLTIARIAAIPVIVLLVLGGGGYVWIAFGLYVIAAVTDWVDGFLARRMDLHSSLGRMLDPIADKMLVAALIVAFAATGDLSGWDLLPALAILMREIFVSGLREFLGGRQVAVHVSTLAKYKTTAQLIAVGAVMLAAALPELALAAQVLLWVAGLLTVSTGVRYLAGAWSELGKPDQ